MPVLRTAIVRYGHEPVSLDLKANSKSLGMLLDERLTNALKAGETLQEIGFQFDESDWHKLASDFHQFNKNNRKV